MVDVNFKGLMYGVAAVLPSMLAKNSGDIIAISSDAGRKLFPGGAVRSLHSPPDRTMRHRTEPFPVGLLRHKVGGGGVPPRPAARDRRNESSRVLHPTRRD